MIITLLVILFVVDLGLAAMLYLFYRKNIAYEDLIGDLNEERVLLGRMQDEIKSIMVSLDSKASQTMDRMTKLAGEIEQEVEQSSQTIRIGLEAVVEEVSQTITPTLKIVGDQQSALEMSCRKAEKERILLQKISGRVENLLKFFNDKLPYDQVLKDIQIKRYDDARHLLTQGYGIEQIAKELGIDQEEIQLIQSTR